MDLGAPAPGKCVCEAGKAKHVVLGTQPFSMLGCKASLVQRRSLKHKVGPAVSLRFSECSGSSPLGRLSRTWATCRSRQGGVPCAVVPGVTAKG